MVITSTANNQIKAIRKLSHKKYRRESGLFYVEGLRQITSAMKHGALIEKLVFCDSLLESEFGRDLVEKADKENIPLLEVSEDVFLSISMKEGPQGLCAVVHQNVQALTEVIALRGLWVALENVQDPGNLGTIMRTLDAVGGEGIILVGDKTTDATHPTSVRASMGAIFTLQVLQASLPELREWLSDHEMDLVGAVCGPVSDYRGYNYSDDMILFMGSEQKGLTTEAKSLCSGQVTIPMVGTVDSLNLANATSILLYEIFRTVHPMEEK